MAYAMPWTPAYVLIEPLGSGGENENRHGVGEALFARQFAHRLPGYRYPGEPFAPVFPPNYRFLDRYYPPPRLAPTITDEDGWRLDRESKHFYYTQPGRGIPTWAVELNEFQPGYSLTTTGWLRASPFHSGL